MKKKIAGFLLAGAIMFGTLAVPNVQAEAAEWKVNQKGWWYQDEDGGWSANEWRKINGQWYWFDSNGYMATGWRNIGGTWYYLQESGAMLGEGWHWLGEKCYYMYGSGAMAANTWIGNDYVDGSGAWVPGKTQITTTKAQVGWVQSGNRWWYRHADGSYTRNGWEKIGGQWYYFDGAGWMLANQWVGDYFVTGSGAMATNTWIGSHYVGADGAWIPGYGVNTHTHTWKEEWHLEPVAEVGHWDKELVAEAWDEPVMEDRTICNTCGMDLTDLSDDEFMSHLADTECLGGYHNEKIPTGEVIHHEAEYKEVWIVDQAAYDKKVIDGYRCSCGATK